VEHARSGKAGGIASAKFNGVAEGQGMSRREEDREDLMAEATALVRRAEVLVRGDATPIVFGFRRDSGLSIYFASDLAFHFDNCGRLKRAFGAGRLYRTQGTTLAELIRDRTDEGVVLHRRDLEGQECHAFLRFVKARLIGPMLAIEHSRFTLLRCVPEDDATILSDFVTFVSPILRADNAEMLAPRFKGKR